MRAGVRVIGIAGSSAAKATACASRLGLEKAYETFDAVLDDPQVDVVHIASPNRLHFDQAASALRAGKHVVCEKPLAMDTAESSALVELAARSGLAAAVNYNIRYYPLCIEAAERVASGSVGEIFHVTGSYTQDWLFHQSDFNWRVLADEGGELRAVADIGTHWLDLIGYVTGQRIESVCADLQTVFPLRNRPLGGAETFTGKAPQGAETSLAVIDTEDAGSILFRFAGGGRGALSVSQVTAGRKNRLQFELAGSIEALAWCSEAPNELWIGHRGQANQYLVRDPALLSPRASAFSSYPGGHNEGFPDTFKQLFRDFYGYLERGDFSASAAFPTFADGHREIEICEAILKSHRERRWVNVGDFE